MRKDAAKVATAGAKDIEDAARAMAAATVLDSAGQIALRAGIYDLTLAADLQTVAARVASWFQAEHWVPEFVRQVYIANFAEDRDIAAARELLTIIRKLELPPTLLDIAESSEAKAKLRDQTERAKALGIFGAPSFISGNELFWGNDRLEAAVAWAQRHEERGL
jgi:2-hydroxychromene-2-carboxylate isomerase